MKYQFKNLNEKSLHQFHKNQPVQSSSKMKTQNIFWNLTSKRFWPHCVRLRLLGRGYGTNWRAFLPSKPSIDVNSNGNLHTFGYTLQSSHGFWIIRWFSRWLTVLPIFIYCRFLILSFDNFFTQWLTWNIKITWWI